MSRTEHPGSTGGWASTFVEYDILGRVKRQSVPTETNSSYTPAGDDSAGALWTYQKYDWMGRVVRKINTDGIDQTTLNDSDVLISYEGCGCAGGLVTTVEGELVPRTDTTGNARRKQKSYADILGRPFKSETFEWDSTTVYSTVLQTFDGADRPVLTRQFAGTTSSSTYQDTTASFDGFGRLYQSHRPEQRDNSNNPTYTTYTYNPDASILSVTDGRGAAAQYLYNSVGLNTQISYSVPQGSGIPVTPTASFSFDNLGNRTQMTDGTGTTTYQLDSLSRIVSETKTFNGLTETFTLEYEYQLNGDVKQLDILPSGTGVTYTHDRIGRVSGVSGQGFSDARFSSSQISEIASNVEYRAWDSLKSMEFGNPGSVDIEYNTRLRTASFTIPNLMEVAYQYNADGRVKFAEDLLNSTFDRSYKFDSAARMIDTKSGAEASGGSQMTGPYRQAYSYDAFSNLTFREAVLWSENYNYAFSASYSNNRRNGWEHDNDGNVVDAPPSSEGQPGLGFTFDADGLNSVLDHQLDATGCSQKYQKKFLYADGDGQIVKTHDDKKHYCGATQWSRDTYEYNVKSTVLGGQVVYQYTDHNAWGNGGISNERKETRIFFEDKLLATFEWSGLYDASWTPQFYWHHIDPMGTYVGTSQLQSSSGHYQNLVAHRDPMGAEVGWGPPEDPEPPPPSGQTWELGSPEAVDWITVDGISAPANHFPPGMLALASRCPNDDCGPIKTEHGWEWWTAYADGYEGYIPMGAHYAGGGMWSWQKLQDRKKRQKPILKTVAKGRKKPKNLPKIDPRTEEEEFDIENIRIGINVIWNNPDCRAVIQGMLNAVETKGNPLVDGGDLSELFERLLTQKNGPYTRMVPPGSLGYGNPIGSFRNNNAQVASPAPNINPSPFFTLLYDIQTTADELMHLAGSKATYTDRDFAEVVQRNPYWAANNYHKAADGPQPYPLSVPGRSREFRDNLETNEGHPHWSAYWHNAVGNLCYKTIDWRNVAFK